jgi:hypothetical protein
MIMSPVFIRKSHLTISLATTETISLFITLWQVRNAYFTCHRSGSCICNHTM